MTVTVLFFAGLRDAVGSERIEIDVDEDSTVSDFWFAIEILHPATIPYRGRVAFAVGDQLVSEKSKLDPMADVAVLPPISGG